MNKKNLKWLFALCVIIICTTSCSVVFRASIDGQIIDKDLYDKDGTVSGIADAKVFLYTKEKQCDEDFAKFVEGNEATLPDNNSAEAYNYFLSTKTGADGAFSFTGFIWDSLFPKYGKTADRYEIFLLFYHKDYGLYKNPVPLYVVSDVNNKLDIIKLEDLWYEASVSGTVKNWKDGKALQNADINIYVAKSWEYDSASNFTNVKYNSSPSYSVVSDADGYYYCDLKFPMKPSRQANKKNAPLRITFGPDNYRASDLSDGTGFANASIKTDVDINENGKMVIDGDYSDAYIELVVNAPNDAGVKQRTNAPEIVLQRWHFSSTVSGTTSDGTNPVNGKEVKLTVPSTNGKIYTAYSDSVINGDYERKGVFNLGTVTWKIKDITGVANQKTGKVSCTVTPSTGGASSLEPDINYNWTLQ